ncbi:serine/threonine protein kinase [Nocardioides terrae]|uniref:non-specific serine/threonine protein kinase n=1 Tax=Nocardioides terrae TaxID=574651 RepID=A0A1I1FPY6_9ACTN|nr:serine/threonine protein kinase [Nocardioides terrae]
MVAGRYELGEQIGAGGSGTVFRAHDRVLDRVVAVKTMRPGADADAHARLRIEARLAGLLAHPGIARVHDFGEEEIGGQVAPYLVMEYVDGASLRDVLHDQAPMAPDRVMGIVAQLADALAVAHAVGIVHRDVKPSNILVRPSGTVALIDFGIARSQDIDPVTLTGTIVGTVDYISPEQAGGAGATPLSDLYALGLVAYECLTGERPLRRDTQVATVLAHVNEDVPALPRTFPEPVRDLVHRLTARDPRRRPADAATAARLARAAIGATVSLAEPGPEHRRRRWLAAAVVAAVAVLGVCLVVGDGGPGPAPAAAGANTSSRAGAAVGAALASTAATTEAASVSAPASAPVATPTAPLAVPAPRGVTHHARRHVRVRHATRSAHAKSHHRPQTHGKGKGHGKRH